MMSISQSLVRAAAIIDDYYSTDADKAYAIALVDLASHRLMKEATPEVAALVIEAYEAEICRRKTDKE